MSERNERQLTLCGGGDRARSKAMVPADKAARDFATDPAHHVVLEASAGTGKTTVLVDRYLNLLRAGVDPSNVLAVTFTRQAAAEMRERIVTRLRAEATESADGLARWRSLRDRLSDMVISTVDAFCLSLLREFPLEADLDPGFGMADDTEVPGLMEEAVERTLVIGGALARDDEGIAMLLAQLGPWRSRTTLTALLSRRLVVQDTIHRFLNETPSSVTCLGICRAAAARLTDRLDGIGTAVDSFFDTGPVDDPAFALVARDLRLVQDLGDEPPSRIRGSFERISDYFLTQKGTARTTFRQTSHSAAVHRRFRASASAIASVVHDEWRVFERDINTVAVTAVHRLFGVAVSEYRRILDERALLDFSDVLQRAIDLLRQMDEFARSRYRLESRYHHVLVDEFQDTSRAQWELVSLLVRSWAEGIGVGDDAPVPPSVFVVGDRKQSIYRFRDADVSVLQDAALDIGRLGTDDDIRRSISQSFRSVPRILAFVNDLFDEIADGSDGPGAFRYTRDDRFPIDEASGFDESSGRKESPLGVVVGDDIEACAETVAAEIARLLADGTIASDIAILFRARASHREFERALSRRSISTYVYKGLGFFDAEEIKDVQALLRFLAAPASELRAAALVRSRIAGISDVALVALEGQVSHALTDVSDLAVIDTLDSHDQSRLRLLRSDCRRWLADVDRAPPAELLDRVLSETAYARELHGAHEEQARENVKKVRSLIRRIQNRGYATMVRVSDQFDRLAGDISTASVEVFDAVNLMTVHAAKGLEFQVVFLVDLGRGTGNQGPSVRVVPDRGDGHPSVTVWPYRDATDTEERRRDVEETKRLMYVAATRARDRMYLSVALDEGTVQVNPGSFAEVLPPGFLPVFEEAAGGADRVHWAGATGLMHEFRVPGPTTTAKLDNDGPGGPRAEARQVPVDLAPVELAAGRTHVVTEDGLADPDVDDWAGLFGARDSGRDDDQLVGLVVHQLFERLHDLTADMTLVEGKARALVRQSRPLDPDRTATLAQRSAAAYVRLRAHPDIVALEGHPRLFEVPYSFRDHALSDEQQPSRRIERGTIDCLVISPDGHVTVLELKTGSRRHEHGAQLARYVSAARTMFPEAEVSGRLVYPA